MLLGLHSLSYPRQSAVGIIGSRRGLATSRDGPRRFQIGHFLSASGHGFEFVRRLHVESMSEWESSNKPVPSDDFRSLWSLDDAQKWDAGSPLVEDAISLTQVPSPFEQRRDTPMRRPHKLVSLDGSQLAFNRLQADLFLVEANGEAGMQAILEAHRILNLAGAFEHSGTFGQWVREYLQGGKNGLATEAPEKVLSTLADLDEQLFARRGVLLEDLSPTIVGRWAREPNMLIDSDKVDEIKKLLYGLSRFPILTDAAREAVGEQPIVSARRRQFVVERETQRAAIREYMEDQEQMEREGRAASTKQRVWMQWVKDMADLIEALREGVWRPSGKGREWTKILRDDIPLEPELLSVITCSTVLNLLLAPNWRRKDDRIKDTGQSQVPYVSVVVAVGDAVSLESSWRTLASGDVKKISPKALAAVRHLSRSNFELQKDITVPLGGALVDLLLQVAKVGVHPSALNPEETTAWECEMEARLGPDWRSDGQWEKSVMVPALKHAIIREGKKTRGYVQLPLYVRNSLDFGQQDLVSFIAAKHQPMLIEPQPWQPSAVGRPEGGYLMANTTFIRTMNQSMTYMRFYSPHVVARVMDSCGRTPWRINRWTLEQMEKVKEQDLAIAEVPPREDPKISPMLEDTSGLSPEELKVMRIRHHNAKKKARELQSERPTFELKLRVARDFATAPRLFFPHNVDFRGRAYPVPPHLNHISDDVCRGLLQFAEPRPLGKEGFFWLRVNLANLLGKNKIPFEERVQVVEEAKETILKVARDPLAPESIAFWANADDGPWQVLANCREIAAVWESGDEENFLSYMPVQLDGSCNGLQHYAALGRDEFGAKAVNVSPSERPQDVYSIVLAIVKEKVQKQACRKRREEQENGEEELEDVPGKMPVGDMARRLIELDVLQRKVVKQTIMTICYGVTTLGAKEQVRGQLEDMVGDRVEQPELKQLAGYLSKLVLKSIDEVFERAMMIKKWFDQVSTLLNRLEYPTSWISPIGLACVQPYKKKRKVSVLTKRQKVIIQDDDGPKVDKAKQKMGFPPNFVHSLDATHMMLVADRCRKEGITFAGVHDSFWTHACDASRLNPIIRDAFVELHGRPILDELYKDISLQIGGTGLVLPDLPEQGGLDIELVRKSPYFFH